MAKAATINISTEAVEQLNEYLNEIEQRINNASNITEEIAGLNEKLGAYHALGIVGIYASDKSSRINFAGCYCGEIKDGVDED